MNPSYPNDKTILLLEISYFVTENHLCNLSVWFFFDNTGCDGCLCISTRDWVPGQLQSFWDMAQGVSGDDIYWGFQFLCFKCEI